MCTNKTPRCACASQVTAELRDTRALIHKLSPERMPLQAAAARNCNPARVSHRDTKRQGPPKAQQVQRRG